MILSAKMLTDSTVYSDSIPDSLLSILNSRSSKSRVHTMSTKKVVKTSKRQPAKPQKKQTLEFDSDDDVSSESEEEIVVENVPPREKELEIECLELHDQILHRPDTYIGSVKKIKYNNQIIVKSGRLVVANPVYSEGLLRIFIEIVSNAIDNVWRSKEFGIAAKKIMVTIDRDSGSTSVWNDGKPIPLDIHKEQKKYKPELIFSRLLTSTNYNDGENKKTSGRNGYGSKLTNIFSKIFNIELYNPVDSKIYRQTWKNNMRERTDPVFERAKVPDLPKKAGYTSVTWTPDFNKFDMTGYDDDTISLYEKTVYDAAMIVSKYGIEVYLNGKKVAISSLKDYALLHLPVKESSGDEEYEDDDSDGEGDDSQDIHMFSSPDSKVVIMPFKKHLSVSFVNGICTTEGGVHNDSWIEAIFRPIVDRINGVKDAKKATTQAEKDKQKKKKEQQKKNTQKIDIGDVKDKFAIFIDSELVNPEFRGQNKTRLSSPNVQTKIKKTDIPKIMKWSVIENIKFLLESRDLAELKVKKRGFTKVEGLDDANFAKKPAKRSDCILCITEGLSAKTYVVQGMKTGLVSRSGKKVAGRDYIGALPIRGKFINPKGRSLKAVAKNKEVKSFVQALGLQTGVDYTESANLDTLRYGRVMIFADADKDGIHIVGLMYNFLNTLYPTILQVPGFFTFARTPIIKISLKKERLLFYHLEQASEYIKKNNIAKTNVKYYKGLGTTNPKDVPLDFGKRIVEMIYTDDTEKMVDNVFNKTRSDYRKNWLTSFDPSRVKIENVDDYKPEHLEGDRFFNDEFITFSIEDCKRSLPNIYDGLKESQRKILYAIFKRRLTYTSETLKVAQLSGYVAEHTGYHHGEDNLQDTIRGMAQRFVGSNNMPLLYNDGQFGTRLENGNDGAHGRYIFTKQESFTRNLFPVADDNYLVNLQDDGDVIEKKYYVPIIPMVLVNGCIGIGTGFSTSIPAYNPLTLISWIRVWIETGGHVVEDLGNGITINEGPELVPWYRNFKGRIEANGHKITTYGVIEELGKGKFRVSELPIGRLNMSISKFKVRLEELLEKKSIRDFDDHSDDNNVDFLIVEDPDGMKISLETLGLTDTIHTSNMVMFTDENKIQKFSSVEDILNHFCTHRLELYRIRREGELKVLKDELKWVCNRQRFIKELTLPDKDKKKLYMSDKTDSQLDEELSSRGYDRKKEKKKKKKNASDEMDDEMDDETDTTEDDETSGSYNYLLDMKMRGATKSRIERLEGEKKRLESEIEELTNKTVQDIWKYELDVLEKKYGEWLKTNDTVVTKSTKSTGSTKSKKEKEKK